MSLDDEIKLKPELGSGERLLWSGAPPQGVIFRSSDVLMVPFSLLWGGFAIFWEYTAITKGADLFFALWGVPFVLVGLYMIFGRFFVDSYLRSRTCYGVTDRRIIILGGLFNREVKSLSLQGLNDLSLSERPDGRGSITFGPSNPMLAMWSGTAWPGVSNKLAPAFEQIDQARKVYTLIRDAQRGDTGGFGSSPFPQATDPRRPA